MDAVRPRIAAVAVSLAALLVLSLAPSSSAGLLERDELGNLFYTHVPGFEDHVAHEVVVEPSPGGYLVRDAGAEVLICPAGATSCGPARCEEGSTFHEAFCHGPVAGLRITSGDRNDTFENRTELESVACGGRGNDLLTGGSGLDRLGGGPGRDEVHGGEGGDLLAVDVARQIGLGPGHACAPGPDAERFELLDGGPGRDRIEAGPGDDILVGGGGDDGLFGYAGDDSIEGGAGRDDLVGAAGADTLRAGDDGDFLFGGPGHDDLEAGPGDDDLGRTIRYDADGLGGATAVVTEAEEGDDRLDGGEGRDDLVAGPGDRLYDTTDSFALLDQGVVDRSLQSPLLNGADTFIGGPGDDLVTYANRGLPVDVSLDALANDGSAGERDRVATDVERVWGSAQADVLRADLDGALLFGDLGGDLVLGGPGPDVLLGGFDDGRDELAGAGGDDELGGGPGDDTLEGGDGMDALVAATGDDRLLGGRGIDGLEGGSGADFLAGGAEPDCLYGFLFPASGPEGCPGAGTSTPVVGADGADVLRGGSGLDRLAGGDGEDIADYSDMRGRVVLVLPGAPAAWASFPSADLLASDVEGARGGRGHDLLVGNGADNALDGGPGDDQVQGEGGVDRLRGGSGRDLVVARDREPDAVRCGTKRDLAVIDGEDELVAALSDVCETVDGGGAIGRGLTRLRPQGDCSLPVRLPRTGQSFLLRAAASLPPRTLVDASACTARLGRSTLRLGAFALVRSGGRVELALRGGVPRRCGRATLDVRRLAVEAGGAGLAVRGRELTAMGQEAAWTVVDGCGGTRVRVRSGRVLVDPHGPRPPRLRGERRSRR
jgi:Ca2+-binding RTX toxin-like protein